VIGEAITAHDPMLRMIGLAQQGFTLAYLGDSGGARASADAALEASAELVESSEGLGYSVVGAASLPGGDAAAAWQAYEAARQRTGTDPRMASMHALSGLAPLACGDPTTARRWADDAVSAVRGGYLSMALTTRARVAIAQGELEQAERDAREALSRAADIGTLLELPNTLECLAGEVRFKVLDADYKASVAALREAMGDEDFDSAWAEGAALSTEDAIAYAQRGRGERKRPTSGWASLTPTERDVVRLVSEGLANNDIATRLFVSPRTVQTHLTHVYTKLGLTSRVQLAQEAARHA